MRLYVGNAGKKKENFYIFIYDKNAEICSEWLNFFIDFIPLIINALGHNRILMCMGKI